MKKKTIRTVIEEINSCDESEYVLLDKYINATTKITLLHKVCNYKWSVTPHSFSKGSNCPNCSKVLKPTNEMFLQNIYDLVGNEYTVLDEYKNARTKLMFLHNVCGHKFKVTPPNFVHNETRCPLCFGTPKKTNEQFIKEMKKLLGNSYILLSEYRGKEAKVDIRHIDCGYLWSTSPQMVLGGSKCPKCSNRFKRTHEEFIAEVFELVKDEYSVIEGTFKTLKTKVKMKHNKCGYKWNVSPSDFLGKGSRCPKCNESKGERIISEYLDSNNFTYKREFRMKDCIHIRPLRFDFAIFDNNKLVCLIEFDGEQHFDLGRWGNDQERKIKELELIKMRDCIKNEYCVENNIPLLRIKYTDIDDINKILNKKLLLPPA